MWLILDQISPLFRKDCTSVVRKKGVTMKTAKYESIIQIHTCMLSITHAHNTSLDTDTACKHIVKLHFAS